MPLLNSTGTLAFLREKMMAELEEEIYHLIELEMVEFERHLRGLMRKKAAELALEIVEQRMEVTRRGTDTVIVIKGD